MSGLKVMPRIRHMLVVGSAVMAVASCTANRPIHDALDHYNEVYARTNIETPSPDPAVAARLGTARVAHGRYLVGIAGCAACHTDGALVGAPDETRLLAGSSVGIAYTDPLQGAFPGVAYPSNLTPDVKTGIGAWSDSQIVAAIRLGDQSPAEHRHLIVMPWPFYEDLSDDDTNAIVAYLRSIPAVEHEVPKRVGPGTRATTPYVYFGVFRSGSLGR
jgi:mono/diheme cytochrome c family protein